MPITNGFTGCTLFATWWYSWKLCQYFVRSRIRERNKHLGACSIRTQKFCPTVNALNNYETGCWISTFFHNLTKREDLIYCWFAAFIWADLWFQLKLKKRGEYFIGYTQQCNTAYAGGCDISFVYVRGM